MFGGGGWGNNNASLQGALTRAELYDGLNAQDVSSGISSIKDNMNTGFDAVSLAMNNGFNGVQIGLNNGFNSVNSNIANLGYQMSQCCCDLKTTMHSEGEATRALIQQNLVQDLRDKLADKDRELLTTGLVTAQTLQTNNLENFIRTLVNGCGCSA